MQLLNGLTNHTLFGEQLPAQAWRFQSYNSLGSDLNSGCYAAWPLVLGDSALSPRGTTVKNELIGATNLKTLGWSPCVCSSAGRISSPRSQPLWVTSTTPETRVSFLLIKYMTFCLTKCFLKKTKVMLSQFLAKSYLFSSKTEILLAGYNVCFDSSGTFPPTESR